jgi:membrane protease YdiL (CAAX protease family)
MIISAVVFGAYHGNLVQFVYAGICGVLLAYLCEKYDSIIAPIVSHMVMNTVAIVFTQWGVFAQIMKSSVVAVLAMLVCTVCAVVMLRVLQKLDVTKVLKIYCKE